MDKILNGEQAENPTASPAETITPENQEEAVNEGAATLSPDETSWSNLSGNAQERFRAVTRSNNELRGQINEINDRLSKISTTSYQPTVSPNRTPEVVDAIGKLSSYGIATDEKVNEIVEKKLNERLGGMVYQQELDKLSSKYSGKDGLPQFDKDEYEDYVNRNPVYRNYAPEDVYKKMYEPEIIEWHSQHKSSSRQASSQSPSLRPTKTVVQQEPMTPELLEQKLNSMSDAERKDYYGKNQGMINAVLSKMGT